MLNEFSEGNSDTKRGTATTEYYSLWLWKWAGENDYGVYVNDNPKINDNLGMTQDIYVGSCREFGYALKKKPSFYFQIVHNVNNIMTFQKPILKVDSEGKRFLIHLFRRRVLKIEFTEDDLIFKIVRIKKATKKYRIAYREDPLLKLKKENKFPTTNLEDIPRLPVSRAFLVGVLVSNVGIQALWRNERGETLGWTNEDNTEIPTIRRNFPNKEQLVIPNSEAQGRTIGFEKRIRGLITNGFTL